MLRLRKLGLLPSSSHSSVLFMPLLLLSVLRFSPLIAPPLLPSFERALTSLLHHTSSSCCIFGVGVLCGCVGGRRGGGGKRVFPRSSGTSLLHYVVARHGLPLHLLGAQNLVEVVQAGLTGPSAALRTGPGSRPIGGRRLGELSQGSWEACVSAHLSATGQSSPFETSSGRGCRQQGLPREG